MSGSRRSISRPGAATGNALEVRIWITMRSGAAAVFGTAIFLAERMGGVKYHLCHGAAELTPSIRQDRPWLDGGAWVHYTKPYVHSISCGINPAIVAGNGSRAKLQGGRDIRSWCPDRASHRYSSQRGSLNTAIDRQSRLRDESTWEEHFAFSVCRRLCVSEAAKTVWHPIPGAVGRSAGRTGLLGER